MKKTKRVSKKKTNPRKLSGNLASASYAARQAADRYVNEKIEEIAGTIARDYLLMLMFVLHDEHGFGKKRLMHIYTRICDISDSISDGLITFEDIRKTLVNECNWDIDNAYIERKQDEVYWHVAENVAENVGGVSDEQK